MSKSKVFGYARVSTKDQSLDRQIQQLLEYGIDEDCIFADKCSGKDFERYEYKTLLNRLRDDDLVVICSIDRLGRNYTEIVKQWDYITNTIQANIKVLDMPLLDTTSNDENNLDKKFLSNMVLQILSYVAEKERLNTKERQRQGIAIARAKGKRIGRPKIDYPPHWHEVYYRWKDKEITAVKAMQLLGLKKSSFYKLVKRFES
jgi:DNA invertase Pin-like site-specific DNA recombinase